MAQRFWVGGGLTTNWSENTLGVTNWATTSGGLDNAAPPTDVDDVTFNGVGLNSNSASTIDTSTAVKTLNITSGYKATLTHNTGVTLAIYGNTLTFGANMVYSPADGTSVIVLVSDTGTSTVPTAITTNGIALNSITFNGAGGHFQLQDTFSGTVTLTAGTLDTNNQTCTWSQFSKTGTGTAVLIMGSSAISVTTNSASAWIVNANGLSITTNTAVVTITQGSINQAVTVGNYNGTTFIFTGAGAVAMAGAGLAATTFGAITRTGTAVKTDSFSISANLTVTGAVTLGGNTTQGVNRLLMQSNTVGTSRTITAGSYVIAGDVDFQDINLAYSGSPSWDNGTTNYCTNGDFETNITGWSVNHGNETLSRDTTVHESGSASLQVICPGSVTFEGCDYSSTVAGTASVGQTWTVSAWVNVPNGATMQIQLVERGSSGSLLAGGGNAVFTGTGTWQQITITAALSNASVSRLGIKISTKTTAQAITFWVDAVQIQHPISFIGDAQGNAGAVTTNANASVNQTWTSSSSGSWSDVSKWTTRVPLPQDDVVISSAFSSGQTLTVDMPRMGRSVDFTGTTWSGTAPTFRCTTTMQLHGSLTLIAGLLRSGGPTLVFAGRSSYTYTPAGVNENGGVSLIAPGGTLTLQGDISASGPQTLNIQSGSFVANNKNVTMGSVVLTVAGTRSVNMGSGIWTLTTSGIVWGVSNITGLTIIPGNSTIIISDTTAAAKVFNGGGFVYGTLQHTATGSGALSINASNQFANLDLECTTARTLTLPAGGTQTITKTSGLTLKGATGNLLLIVSSTPGTTSTLSMASGTVAGDYLEIQDNTATGGATFNADTTSNSSIKLSNVSGWNFGTGGGTTTSTSTSISSTSSSTSHSSTSSSISSTSTSHSSTSQSSTSRSTSTSHSSTSQSSTSHSTSSTSTSSTSISTSSTSISVSTSSTSSSVSTSSTSTSTSSTSTSSTSTSVSSTSTSGSTSISSTSVSTTSYSTSSTSSSTSISTSSTSSSISTSSTSSSTSISTSSTSSSTSISVSTSSTSSSTSISISTSSTSSSTSFSISVSTSSTSSSTSVSISTSSTSSSTSLSTSSTSSSTSLSTSSTSSSTSLSISTSSTSSSISSSTSLSTSTTTSFTTSTSSTSTSSTSSSTSTSTTLLDLGFIPRGNIERVYNSTSVNSLNPTPGNVRRRFDG